MSYPNNSVDDGQLRAIVERLERMGEERRAIADDIKDIYAEAKGNGFDTKALKVVIRHREQDASKRQELEAVVELYLTALGMADAPREDDEPPARAPARESAKSVPDHSSEARNMVDVITPNANVPAGFDPETGAESTTPEPSAFEQIREGLTEALSVAKGEVEPYRVHTIPPDLVAQAGPVTAAFIAAGGDAVETPALISDACQNALRLRPHCLAAMQNEITKCGGHGKVHCSTCLKAHADAEGISA